MICDILNRCVAIMTRRVKLINQNQDNLLVILAGLHDERQNPAKGNIHLRHKLLGLRLLP
jgi:hypothetical protein